MLRGASADAVADLTDQVGKTRTLADSATLGEQLFGVAGVLRSEPGLRRVATDTSVEPDAKAGLMQNVFGSALEAAALDLVTEAVRRRWTSSRDLPDALEHLGAVALVRSAGKDSGTVSDELFAVRQLVDGNPDLRAALSDPARSVADRTALLRGLLDGKMLPATLSLVEQSVATWEGTVDTALVRYQLVAAEANDTILATVTSARALSQADRARLTGALEKQYDRNVHLHVVVDPELVGGVRIDVGDDVIDGSVVSRLDGARRQLAG